MGDTNKPKVYIDTPMRGWSHMGCSCIHTLHIFARSNGIGPHYYENKRGKNQPHYDVKRNLYKKVIDAGAIPVTRRDFFTLMAHNFEKL